MKNDKTGAFPLMIIKRMRGGSEEATKAPMKDNAIEDSSIGLKAAAEDMMSAMKDGDSEKLMMAMKSFIRMVDNDSDG